MGLRTFHTCDRCGAVLGGNRYRENDEYSRLTIEIAAPNPEYTSHMSSHRATLRVPANTRLTFHSNVKHDVGSSRFLSGWCITDGSIFCGPACLEALFAEIIAELRERWPKVHAPPVRVLKLTDDAINQLGAKAPKPK